MTDERFAEISRSPGFSVYVDDDYAEPTLVDGAWYMSHADHHDLRIRLASANAMADLGDHLAGR